MNLFVRLTASYRFWFIAYLIVCISTHALVKSNNDAEDLSKFLYLKEAPNSVFPVQEYKAAYPEEQPDFLFQSDYPNARIVEYYAHWCPHCQHFKPQYIEFAKKMQDTVAKLPLNFQVEVRAISCVPNKVICGKADIHGYPTLLLYPPFSTNATTINRSKMTPNSILKELGVETEAYSAQKQILLPLDASNGVGDSSVERGDGIVDEMMNNLPHHFLHRSKKETFDDAHLSLDFLLRNGVFMSPNPLDGTAKSVLTTFLKILGRTLPASSSMYPLVNALSAAKSRIAKSEEDLLKVMDEVSPPPSPVWSKASLQHGTGYTAGLWQLFHIVTIGTVEWNSGTADHETRISPLEVADSIRNFIEHFFQCDECRSHFLHEYDSCAHDRCNRLSSDRTTSTVKDWKELPLWLYETHNGVNMRLRGERLANNEDEDTTEDWQVQWPAVYECPKCWLSHGRWDEIQTYNFLRLQYWPEDHNSKELQQELRHDPNGLHPDVEMAIKNYKLSSEISVPDASTPYLVLILFVLVSSTGAYMYHRKRRYNRQGQHKKMDSFGDC